MLRAIGWVLLAAAGIVFPLAVLAAYDVTGSSAPEPFQAGFWGVAATVDIDPDTLNPESQGKFVTAYIELPDAFDVGHIDVLSVRLCLGQVTACPEEDAFVKAKEHPTAVGDHDGDTVPDLMVKFDRQDLIELLDGETGDVTMTVAGMVSPPGRSLAGSDTVRGIASQSQGAVPSGEEEDIPLPPPAPSPTAPGSLPDEGELKPDEAACQDCPDGAVGDAESAAPQEAPSPPPMPTIEYQVQPGDTLTAIAARFGTTVEALVRLNGLQQPNLILYGSTLNVPYVGEDAGGAPAGVSPVQVDFSLP